MWDYTSLDSNITNKALYSYCWSICWHDPDTVASSPSLRVAWPVGGHRRPWEWSKLELSFMSQWSSIWTAPSWSTRNHRIPARPPVRCALSRCFCSLCSLWSSLLTCSVSGFISVPWWCFVFSPVLQDISDQVLKVWSLTLIIRCCWNLQKLNEILKVFKLTYSGRCLGVQQV